MSINRNEATALREQRTKAHAHMSSLLQKEQTNEIRGQVQRVINDINAMTEKITKTENPGAYVPATPYCSDEEVRHTAAFDRFVRGGLDNLTAEQRSLIQSKRETRDISEGGAQGPHVGTYSNLGYFVPTGFVAAVEQAKKYFSSFDDIAQIMKTSTGNAIPWPVSNDVSNKATVVGESIEVTELDPASTSHVVFQAFKLKSGLIKASNELLEDSGIDIQAWLADRFAERFGRGEENLFTKGTGSGQPFGVLPAIAASGATPVTAIGSAANTGGSEDGTNSIGYVDLVNLEHAVDPSYRQRAKYMLADNTLGTLKKLLDKFGRPLWVPGVSVGAPDTINGYEYVINQSMDPVAAGNTTMVFGDFSKFVVRRVGSMTMRRLVERYAELDQVGFLAFERVDSQLLDAGTHPLNVLVQHT
jgi:HK97 family phage major capsid protein